MTTSILKSTTSHSGGITEDILEVIEKPIHAAGGDQHTDHTTTSASSAVTKQISKTNYIVPEEAAHLVYPSPYSLSPPYVGTRLAFKFVFDAEGKGGGHHQRFTVKKPMRIAASLANAINIDRFKDEEDTIDEGAEGSKNVTAAAARKRSLAASSVYGGAGGNKLDAEAPTTMTISVAGGSGIKAATALLSEAMGVGSAVVPTTSTADDVTNSSFAGLGGPKHGVLSNLKPATALLSEATTAVPPTLSYASTTAQDLRTPPLLVAGTPQGLPMPRDPRFSVVSQTSTLVGEGGFAAMTPHHQSPSTATIAGAGGVPDSEGSFNTNQTSTRHHNIPTSPKQQQKSAAGSQINTPRTAAGGGGNSTTTTTATIARKRALDYCSDLEKGIIREINRLRQRPKLYLNELIARRREMIGSTVWTRCSGALRLTEGTAAIDDAIRHLREVLGLKVVGGAVGSLAATSRANTTRAHGGNNTTTVGAEPSSASAGDASTGQSLRGAGCHPDGEGTSPIGTPRLHNNSHHHHHHPPTSDLNTSTISHSTGSQQNNTFDGSRQRASITQLLKSTRGTSAGGAGPQRRRGSNGGVGVGGPTGVSGGTSDMEGSAGCPSHRMMEPTSARVSKTTSTASRGQTQYTTTKDHRSGVVADERGGLHKIYQSEPDLLAATDNYHDAVREHAKANKNNNGINSNSSSIRPDLDFVDEDDADSAYDDLNANDDDHLLRDSDDDNDEEEEAERNRSAAASSSHSPQDANKPLPGTAESATEAWRRRASSMRGRNKRGGGASGAAATIASQRASPLVGLADAGKDDTIINSVDEEHLHIPDEDEEEVVSDEGSDDNDGGLGLAPALLRMKSMGSIGGFGRAGTIGGSTNSPLNNTSATNTALLGLTTNGSSTNGATTGKGAGAASRALGILSVSTGLCLAAQDHAYDIGPRGLTTHRGTRTESSVRERVERYGVWLESCYELMSFGIIDPVDMVCQFLIDDGVPTRFHRQLLLSNKFSDVGLKVGPHAVFGAMCCIVVAGRFLTFGTREMAGQGQAPSSSAALIKAARNAPTPTTRRLDECSTRCPKCFSVVAKNNCVYGPRGEGYHRHCLLCEDCHSTLGKAFYMHRSADDTERVLCVSCYCAHQTVTCAFCGMSCDFKPPLAQDTAIYTAKNKPCCEDCFLNEASMFNSGLKHHKKVQQQIALPVDVVGGEGMVIENGDDGDPLTSA